jgi:mono/diheme cytochrome c family protein
MVNLRNLAGAAALLAAGFGTAHAQTAPDATAGKTLFVQNCSVCHQASGAGGLHFGNAVSADLRAPELETEYHNDDSLILRAILYAKDETGAPLDAPMPVWAGRISTAQAKDILAYLHTLHS